MSSRYNFQNYEITLILNPNSREEELHNFIKNSLPNVDYSIEALGERELAYKVKGKTSAPYYVVDVLSDTENIRNFQRRATFNKDILRFLVINIDKEKGLSRDFPINFKARQIAKILRKEEEQELADKSDDKEDSFGENIEATNGEINGEEDQSILEQESHFAEEKSNSEPLENTLFQPVEEEVEEKIRFSEIFEEELDIQGQEFQKEEEDGVFDVKKLFISMGFREEDIPEDIEEQIENIRREEDEISEQTDNEEGNL